MHALIKRILLFLLPILKQSSIEVIADTMTKMAYPDRPPRRRGIVSYNRIPRQRRSQASYIEPKPEGVDYAERVRLAKLRPYHDVLMVAFDITGPNITVVQSWLEEAAAIMMLDAPTGVSVDSTWIADDDADGDCDSAVFVSKGKQNEARNLLREHGLVK